MKRQGVVSPLLVGVLLLVTSALPASVGPRPAPWFDGATVPPPLVAAHRAWLRGDAAGVVGQVMALLRGGTSSSEVARNALRLIEATYSSRGQVPVRAHWKGLGLVHEVEIHGRRVAREQKITYQLEIQGDTVRPGQLADVSLSTLSGKVLLGKALGKGSWREFAFPRVDRKHGFFLSSEESGNPIPDGWYRLRFVLKDGRSSEDWIGITQLSSTASPTIAFPLAGQELATRNPTARWTAFRSPESRGGEKREAEVRVIRVATASLPLDERVGPWWGAFLEPKVASIWIGTRYQNGVGFGEPELRDGPYLLRLAYAESRDFGDTTLVRESVTMVPFSIRLAE